VSQDERWVVEVDEHSNLKTRPTSGGDWKPLLSDSHAGHFSLTPDGNWVLYHSVDSAASESALAIGATRSVPHTHSHHFRMVSENRRATVAVFLVQEVQLFRPDPLQPPQRHFPNDTRHLPNQPTPTRQIPHRGGERAAVRRSGFAHQVHDGRLPIGVLLEDRRLGRSGARASRQPICNVRWARSAWRATPPSDPRRRNSGARWSPPGCLAGNGRTGR